MNDPESAKLFEALSFSIPDATKIAKTLNKACIVFGLAGGVGPSMPVLEDLNKPMQAPAKGRAAFISALVGLGVGIVFVGSACQMVKVKIVDIINGYETADAALKSITPSERAMLIRDGQALLGIADKIDRYFEEEKELSYGGQSA